MIFSKFNNTLYIPDVSHSLLSIVFLVQEMKKPLFTLSEIRIFLKEKTYNKIYDFLSTDKFLSSCATDINLLSCLTNNNLNKIDNVIYQILEKSILIFNNNKYELHFPEINAFELLYFSYWFNLPSLNRQLVYRDNSPLRVFILENETNHIMEKSPDKIPYLLADRSKRSTVYYFHLSKNPRDIAYIKPKILMEHFFENFTLLPCNVSVEKILFTIKNTDILKALEEFNIFIEETNIINLVNDYYSKAFTNYKSANIDKI